MDLAQDILRLAEKVAQVPGLSIGCSLAMQIIKTVQISKNNTARLQYLAHSVATHLVTIADHMHGRWDNVSEPMKGRLDEFEAVLRSITKVVTKYSKTARVVAFVNASDRELEITQIEKRLADAQRSVLILLGVDASVALHTLGTGLNLLLRAVDSQQPLWKEAVQEIQRTSQTTYSGVLRIENAIGRVAPPPDSHLDDLGLRTYTRHDLRLVRKITSSSLGSGPGNTLIVSLHEAQRSTDGQVVLVRSYEGSNPRERARKFSQDLSAYTNFWEAPVLQVVGASASTFAIPFQVCHAPEGQMETAQNWLNRTMRDNPVETIYGLYDMRSSVKALCEFQNGRGVRCLWAFEESVVNVRTNRNRLEWALIYTGEISHGQTLSTIHREYDYVFLWRGTPSVVYTFSRGSKSWAEGAASLDAIFSHGIQNVDINALGSVLFENGCLGAATHLPPPSTTVALGDVGYTSEDGRFVVVSSLHSLLTSADGEALTWDCKLKPLPEDALSVEYPGETYKRYEHRQHSSYLYHLRYTNLNERHAWTVLRDHVSKLVACHSLTINTHDMKLVVRVHHWGEFDAYYHSTADSANRCDAESTSANDALGVQLPPVETCSKDSMDVDQVRIQRPDNAVASSDIGIDAATDISGQRSSTSSTHSSFSPPPPYYVFAQDAPDIRSSGVPVLPPCPRASFRAEPEWLVHEDPFRVEGDAESNVWTRVEADGKRGLLEKRDYWIDYFQLPPGVALPYVEEVVEP